LVAVLLDVCVVGDTQDAAVARGDEQLTEGAVDEVVAGVEEPAARGGIAKAAVEVVRDGHAVFSFRSRRTPVQAASPPAPAPPRWSRPPWPHPDSSRAPPRSGRR